MNALETNIIAHDFLKSIPSEYSEHLLKNAREAEFEPDEIIFREGEPANRFFLVESGEVAIEKRNRAPLKTIGAGDVFGWSWLFPPFSWHFQARAIKPTRVIILDGAHLLVASEENPAFGYELMKRVARIVIHRLEEQKYSKSPYNENGI